MLWLHHVSFPSSSTIPSKTDLSIPPRDLQSEDSVETLSWVRACEGRKIQRLGKQAVGTSCVQGDLQC